MKRYLWVAAVLAAMCVLTGCGGKKTETESQTTEATVIEETETEADGTDGSVSEDGTDEDAAGEIVIEDDTEAA